MRSPSLIYVVDRSRQVRKLERILMRPIRRCISPVALLVLGTFAHAGRVTSTFSLPNPAAVNALQRDSAGHVFLSGNTGSTTGLPADTADAFVAKLSSDGTV